MARTGEPQRRDDILQAARAVLLAEGYAGARMAAIATRAGVAPGTLYLYFPSKEAIVAALVNRFYLELTAAVIPIMGQPDAAAAIAQTVETVFRFMAAERDLLKLARLEVGLRKPSALTEAPNANRSGEPDREPALAGVVGATSARDGRRPASVAEEELAPTGYLRLPAHLRLQRELARILRARMAEGAIRQYDAEALAELLDGLFERIADLCLFSERSDVSVYTTTLLAFLRAALLPITPTT